MDHTAKTYMAGARAALANIKMDAAIPETERLECFYLLAVEAGDEINATLDTMRKSMAAAEIERVIARLKRPERPRARRRK